MKTTHFQSILVLLIFLSAMACSKNDDSAKPGGGLGEGNLTVSGAVEGKFSGMADFELGEYSSSRIFDISIHDFNPQTFSLSIQSLGITDEIEIPGPGTYTIGTFPHADFHANFTRIIDEDFVNATEYSTFFAEEEGSGTLTITSSDGKTMKGSFEFVAHEIDDDEVLIGSVTIKGEFTANKRIH